MLLVDHKGFFINGLHQFTQVAPDRVEDGPSRITPCQEEKLFDQMFHMG